MPEREERRARLALPQHPVTPRVAADGRTTPFERAPGTWPKDLARTNVVIVQGNQPDASRPPVDQAHRRPCASFGEALGLRSSAMTDDLDVLLVLLPLVALGHAAYRASRNRSQATSIFLRAFLASGVVLFLLSLAGTVGLFPSSQWARPEELDMAMKAGFGMMAAALVCAIAGRKNDHYK